MKKSTNLDKLYDIPYEEMEMDTLENIEELKNAEFLEDYYNDFNGFGKDLTELIKKA
jgi:hypothetical protein